MNLLFKVKIKLIRKYNNNLIKKVIKGKMILKF